MNNKKQTMKQEMRNKPKPDRKDKDIHLHVLGVPKGNVNVNKTPYKDDNADFYKISIDTSKNENNERSVKGKRLKSPKQPIPRAKTSSTSDDGAPKVTRPKGNRTSVSRVRPNNPGAGPKNRRANEAIEPRTGLGPESPRRLSPENRAISGPDQLRSNAKPFDLEPNKKNAPITNTGDCFTIPGEQEQPVKIVGYYPRPAIDESDSPLPHTDTESTHPKIKPKRQSRRKQVGFADLDEVYGTTPESSDIESDSSLPDKRTPPRVYQTENSVDPENDFIPQESFKIEILPKLSPKQSPRSEKGAIPENYGVSNQNPQVSRMSREKSPLSLGPTKYPNQPHNQPTEMKSPMPEKESTPENYRQNNQNPQEPKSHMSREKSPSSLGSNRYPKPYSQLTEMGTDTDDLPKPNRRKATSDQPTTGENKLNGQTPTLKQPNRDQGPVEQLKRQKDSPTERPIILPSEIPGKRNYSPDNSLMDHNRVQRETPPNQEEKATLRADRPSTSKQWPDYRETPKSVSAEDHQPPSHAQIFRNNIPINEEKVPFSRTESRKQGQPEVEPLSDTKHAFSQRNELNDPRNNIFPEQHSSFLPVKDEEQNQAVESPGEKTEVQPKASPGHSPRSEKEETPESDKNFPVSKPHLSKEKSPLSLGSTKSPTLRNVLKDMSTDTYDLPKSSRKPISRAPITSDNEPKGQNPLLKKSTTGSNEQLTKQKDLPSGKSEILPGKSPSTREYLPDHQPVPVKRPLEYNSSMNPSSSVQRETPPYETKPPLRIGQPSTINQRPDSRATSMPLSTSDQQPSGSLKLSKENSQINEEKVPFFVNKPINQNQSKVGPIPVTNKDYLQPEQLADSRSDVYPEQYSNLPSVKDAESKNTFKSPHKNKDLNMKLSNPDYISMTPHPSPLKKGSTSLQQPQFWSSPSKVESGPEQAPYSRSQSPYEKENKPRDSLPERVQSKSVNYDPSRSTPKKTYVSSPTSTSDLPKKRLQSPNIEKADKKEVYLPAQDVDVINETRSTPNRDIGSGKVPISDKDKHDPTTGSTLGKKQSPTSKVAPVEMSAPEKQSEYPKASSPSKSKLGAFISSLRGNKTPTNHKKTNDSSGNTKPDQSSNIYQVIETQTSITEPVKENDYAQPKNQSDLHESNKGPVNYTSDNKFQGQSPEPLQTKISNPDIYNTAPGEQERPRKSMSAMSPLTETNESRPTNPILGKEPIDELFESTPNNFPEEEAYPFSFFENQQQEPSSIPNKTTNASGNLSVYQQNVDPHTSRDLQLVRSTDPSIEIRNNSFGEHSLTKRPSEFQNDLPYLTGNEIKDTSIFPKHDSGEAEPKHSDDELKKNQHFAQNTRSKISLPETILEEDENGTTAMVPTSKNPSNFMVPTSKTTGSAVVPTSNTTVNSLDHFKPTMYHNMQTGNKQNYGSTNKFPKTDSYDDADHFPGSPYSLDNKKYLKGDDVLAFPTQYKDDDPFAYDPQHPERKRYRYDGEPISQSGFEKPLVSSDVNPTYNSPMPPSTDETDINKENEFKGKPQSEESNYESNQKFTNGKHSSSNMSLVSDESDDEHRVPLVDETVKPSLFKPNENDPMRDVPPQEQAIYLGDVPNNTYQVFYTPGTNKTDTGTVQSKVSEKSNKSATQKKPVTQDNKPKIDKVAESSKNETPISEGPKGILIFVNKKSDSSKSPFDEGSQRGDGSDRKKGKNDGQARRSSASRGTGTTKGKSDTVGSGANRSGDSRRHPSQDTSGRKGHGKDGGYSGSGTRSGDSRRHPSQDTSGKTGHGKDGGYTGSGRSGDSRTHPSHAPSGRTGHDKDGGYTGSGTSRSGDSRRHPNQSTSGRTGYGKDGGYIHKKVKVEKSPSGSKITQTYPCGCVRYIISDPDKELKKEELISAYCTNGSQCEVAHPELLKSKMIIPYGFDDYSQRGRQDGFPDIEVVADGIVSKKPIPFKKPSSTMNGAKLTGTVRIKSNRLNGVCNFYIDRKLKRFLRNNMDTVKAFLEEGDDEEEEEEEIHSSPGYSQSYKSQPHSQKTQNQSHTSPSYKSHGQISQSNSHMSQGHSQISQGHSQISQGHSQMSPSQSQMSQNKSQMSQNKSQRSRRGS